MLRPSNFLSMLPLTCKMDVNHTQTQGNGCGYLHMGWRAPILSGCSTQQRKMRHVDGWISTNSWNQRTPLGSYLLLHVYKLHTNADIEKVTTSEKVTVILQLLLNHEIQTKNTLASRSQLWLHLFTSSLRSIKVGYLG